MVKPSELNWFEQKKINHNFHATSILRQLMVIACKNTLTLSLCHTTNGTTIIGKGYKYYGMVNEIE